MKHITTNNGSRRISVGSVTDTGDVLVTCAKPDDATGETVSVTIAVDNNMRRALILALGGRNRD